MYGDATLPREPFWWCLAHASARALPNAAAGEAAWPVWMPAARSILKNRA
jgi:hypothetical protein